MYVMICNIIVCPFALQFRKHYINVRNAVEYVLDIWKQMSGSYLKLNVG